MPFPSNVELSDRNSWGSPDRNSWGSLREELLPSDKKATERKRDGTAVAKTCCGKKYGMQCMALSYKNIILLKRSGKKYGMQCMALSYKNIILLKRNKLSSLVALFCPAIAVLVLGLLVLAQTYKNSTPIPKPEVDYCIGNSCDLNGNLGGGTGDAFPRCLVFDRAGGSFGYGRRIPGAKCTSVMYSPSNNKEVAKIMSLAAKKSKMSHTSGGHARAELKSVLGYDVYGMATDMDLNSFVSDKKHMGYVGAVVRFNATDEKELGDNIYYEIWYNKTVITNSWIANANNDNMAITYSTSSFILRLQRTVNEAIIGVRGRERAKLLDEASADLTVNFKRFPRFAVPKDYKNNCEEDLHGVAAVSSTGPFFFYLAVMLHFLLAMSTVVREREKGMLGAMRTVGVSEAVYWASWLVYFGVLLFFSVLLLIATGLIFGEDLIFFKYTEFGVLFPLFYVYGMTMVAIAFMFAACLKTTKKVATVGGGIFVLGLAAVAFFISAGKMLSHVLMDPNVISRDLLFVMYGAFPPLAFGTVANSIQSSTRAQLKTDPLTNISRYVNEMYTVANYSGFPVTLDPSNNQNEYISTALSSFHCPEGKTAEDCAYHSLSMAAVFSPVPLMFFVALALAWYFGQVCASGDGRSRPFYFVCNPSYWFPWCRAGNKTPSNVIANDDEDMDPNVKIENKKCREGDKTMAAIRCSNLVKRYGDFTAVNGLCVSMEKGKIFALLGHNGAGKTTTIKMMTGLENISAGEIDVSGYNIETETQNVRENIGVCPQHDVLWPQLTAREHLEIYTMFKGVWDAKEEIDMLLEGVKLTDVQHKECGKFSGGMKRRLSVAISAVGNPDVIFLDEPTTGMDPMNRKSVWDTIKTFKTNKCVVLTTHSMEEADALGDRIGIMSHGKMVAIGTSLELKSLYGAGYRVKLVCEQANPIKEIVARIMPNAKLVDDSAGSLSYGVGKDSMDKMSDLFQWIEANRNKLSDTPLTDWAVSNTTLEEVFIELARNDSPDELSSPMIPGEPSNPIALDITEPLSTTGNENQKDDSNSVEPKSNANVNFGLNRDDERKVLVVKQDKPLSIQYRALFEQRFHIQKRQFRGNLKLLLCPLLGIILMLVIFNVFDDIQKNIDAKITKALNDAKKQCENCRDISKSVCSSCVKLGKEYDLERRYQQSEECKNSAFDNGYTTEASQYFNLCRLCTYCSSTTFSNAPASRRDTENWKESWNGTYCDYCPTFEVGCDAILEVCNQNMAKGVCSCSRAEPIYSQFEYNVACGGPDQGCGLEARLLKPNLVSLPPFIIPETIDNKVQYSNHDKAILTGQRYLLRPGSTSARIAIVRPESKANYVGENPGGFCESIAGLNCRQENGLSYDITDENKWPTSFPPSTSGSIPVCETRGMDESNPYKYGYQNLIEKLAQSKFGAKQSGLVGHMAQDIVYVTDYFNSSYRKKCSSEYKTCDTSCKCVGVRAKNYDPDQPGPFYECADTSCTESGKVGGICPAVTKRACSVEQYNLQYDGCYNKPSSTQKVFLSPSYVVYDSAETIDENVYVAQEKILTDPIPFKFREAMEAMESVDRTFLSAAIIFNSVDEQRLRYDITLQSYFTTPGCPCCFLDYFPLVHLPEETDIQKCTGYWGESMASSNKKWNVMLGVSVFGFTNYRRRHHLGTGHVEIGTPNWLLSVVSNAILRKEGLGTTITTGVRPLPFFQKTEDGMLQFINAFKVKFGYLVVALALCLTFSPLITTIVEEKERKLTAMMRMMGMDDRVGVLVAYLWNLVFASIFNTWLLIIGKIASSIYGGETIFSRSDGLIMFFLFLVYSHSQAIFIFFVSNFFQRAKKVSTFSTVMMVLSSILMLVLEDFLFTTASWKGQPAPFYIMLIPPFALFRGVQLVNKQAMTWDTLTLDHELFSIFGYLIISSVLFSLFDMYARKVLPREFGVRQPWNFPCRKMYTMLYDDNRGERLSGPERRRSQASITENNASSEGKIAEDDDVTKERENVVQGVYNSDNSHIITYGLNKMYGTFTAVNTLTFHVPKGECFGLLGPNGAGKTTAISMLTGLFPPTKGNANLCGYDLEHELKSIYSVMGICPQFDVCWPQLTIKEHLEFYARIKGVKQNQMKKTVVNLLKAVDLLGAQDKLSKDLSGGMRRRLSLAMALVGDPAIVFLDEPTTGLDPETKRNIWALLDRVKRDRCIVLTTHSMDEADALCGRIGIMSHGLMRCLGTNLHLKNRYGNGYQIEIRFVPEKKIAVQRFIMKLLPKAELVEESGNDVMIYKVRKSHVALSKVFEAMQKRSSTLGILDYGIRQTSLEEVFLKIARESEAAFKAK